MTATRMRLSPPLAWLRSAFFLGSALACCWALAQKIDDIPPAGVTMARIALTTHACVQPIVIRPTG